VDIRKYKTTSYEGNFKILIQVTYRCKYNPLTPKGPRGVFLQKRSKSAISSSRSPNEIIFTFMHFQP
jgi:hypothetical protein